MVAVDLNNDGRINDEFGTSGFELFENVFFPTFERSRFDNRDERIAVDFGAQFRPSSSWEIGADYLYSNNKRTNRRRDTDYVFPSTSTAYETIPAGAYFTADSIRIEENADGQNQVLALDYSGLRRPLLDANGDVVLDANGDPVVDPNPVVGPALGIPYTPVVWIYGAEGLDDQILHTGGGYAQFENGPWMARLDVSSSFSRRDNTLRSSNFGYGQVSDPAALTFTTDSEGLPVFDFTPNSLTDNTTAALFGLPTEVLSPGAPFNGTLFANFGPAGSVFTRIEQEQFAVKFDAHRNLDGLFGIDQLTVKAGTRYTKTEFMNRTANIFAPIDIAASILPEFGSTATVEFNSTTRGPLFLGDIDRLFSAFPILTEEVPEAIAGRPIGTSPEVPGSTFFPTPVNEQDAEEQTLAIYGQLDFADQIGALPFSGNAGLRAVRDTVEGTGASAINAQYQTAFTPQNIVNEIRSQSNEQWVYLPSLNLAIQPTDDIQLRFGVTRSITRPPFGALVPSDIVTVGPQGGNFLTVSGSNVALLPYTAWNYDLNSEFYAPNDGAFYASVFYKDVKDFIVEDTQFSVPASSLAGTIADNIARIPSLAAEIEAACNTPNSGAPACGANNPVLSDPRFGGTVVDQVAVPFNAGEGQVFGVELGFNQPFTFLPGLLKYSGLQASYTFVDTELNTGFFGETFGFAGTAKHQVSAVAYYEQGPVGVRLGYNYRGETELGGGLRQRAENLVDAVVSYDVTDWLELSVEGRNLTEQDRHNYFISQEFLRDYASRPRVITFGARANF